MKNIYPTIVRRYLSSFIDIWVVMLFYFVSFVVFQGDDQFTSTIRFAVPTLFFLLYEPVLTSKFFTLGQCITGIRVRDEESMQPVPLVRAYIRTFIKFFLGFISFFSIIFSERSKAVHDYLVSSIVVDRAGL